MRPASLRDALALHLSLTLANRSRYLFYCRDWICLDCIENSSLGRRQRLCPNDITDTITDITDIIPDICSASWTAGLVARLVPLAAPWRLNLCHKGGDSPPMPDRRKPARPLVSSSNVRRTRSGSQSSSSRGSGLPALYVPSRSVS